MPNVNLTNDEREYLHHAMLQAISSAKRQQNTKGRTNTMVEVFEKHERVLQNLLNKIMDAK